MRAAQVCGQRRGDGRRLVLAALDLGDTPVAVPALPGFTAPLPAGFPATKEAYADWAVGEAEALFATLETDAAGIATVGGWTLGTAAGPNALRAAAAALGVAVTPPESVRADPEDRESGVRLCLGGPSTEDVTRGLSLLAGLQPSQGFTNDGERSG